MFDFFNKIRLIFSKSTQGQTCVDTSETYTPKLNADKKKLSKYPWLRDYSEMTELQKQAIGLPIDQNILISGFPRSGKKLILFFRAQYLMNQYNIPPERFAIIVANSDLRDYVSSILDAFMLPKTSVLTIKDLLDDYNRNHLKSESCQTNLNVNGYVDLTVCVLPHLNQARQDQNAIYDFVLIDEVQNVSHNDLKFLGMISRHVTACMAYEGINDLDRGTAEIMQQLGTSDVFELRAHFTCHEIANFAAQFINVSNDRDKYISQSNTQSASCDVPSIFYALNREQEVIRIMEIIDKSYGQRIGIIFPTVNKANEFRQWFRKVCLNWLTNYNKNNPPEIMTYDEADGREFDVVIMASLREVLFEKIVDVEHRIFSGITRALKNVYIISWGKVDSSSLSNILALRTKGLAKVEVQRRKKSRPFLQGDGTGLKKV
ncbi:MAG TPA: hypothetical protein VL122_06080 [Nitrospirota bacterium]|nr:hypothetical protein [Nitrospirota bacterium]